MNKRQFKPTFNVCLLDTVPHMARGLSSECLLYPSLPVPQRQEDTLQYLGTVGLVMESSIFIFRFNCRPHGELAKYHSDNAEDKVSMTAQDPDYRDITQKCVLVCLYAGPTSTLSMLQ